MVLGGGSSSVLSRRPARSSFMRCASRTTATRWPPSTGSRTRSPTRCRTVPGSGFISSPILIWSPAPDGASRCRSAWLPCSTIRQVRHARQGRSAPTAPVHSSAAARSSARVNLPTEAGPLISTACGTCEPSMAWTAATAAGWPTVRKPSTCVAQARTGVQPSAGPAFLRVVRRVGALAGASASAAGAAAGAAASAAGAALRVVRRVGALAGASAAAAGAAAARRLGRRGGLAGRPARRGLGGGLGCGDGGRCGAAASAAGAALRVVRRVGALAGASAAATGAAASAGPAAGPTLRVVRRVGAAAGATALATGAGAAFCERCIWAKSICSSSGGTSLHSWPPLRGPRSAGSGRSVRPPPREGWAFRPPPREGSAYRLVMPPVPRAPPYRSRSTAAE